MGGDQESTATTVPLNDPSDVSLPLAGFVICGTSVPDEKRAKLEEYAKQMGATYSLDLTGDVTHLIVGSYKTPKYQYVAKQRPDVKPMRVEWLQALRNLWIKDEGINVESLEKEYTLPTLHSLKISMTGCDDPTERQSHMDQIEANGAEYSGDLTKQITHLVSFRTEGAKYKAAKSWKLQIVSIEWLRDSLERGMILDESLYDPTMPVEERGKGAWDRSKPTKRRSTGKRSRDDNVSGPRKLRRTASAKLNSQSESIWGDIVGGGAPVMQVARSGVWDSHSSDPAQQNNKEVQKKSEQASSISVPPRSETTTPIPNGIFTGSKFYLHGFTPKRTEVLCKHLVPQGAEISPTLEELPSASGTDTPASLFVIFPHDLPISAHPELPSSQIPIKKVTHWWVERCLYHKKFMDPSEHIIGRPFPKFPIEGFPGMTICSSAFTGIDLPHIKTAVELLGATYSEEMTSQSSVLVNKALTGLRKDKFDHAQQWNVPIVKADWLWDSIEAGTKLSMKKYRCRSQKRSESLPYPKEKLQSRDVTRPASAAGAIIQRANSLPSKHAKPPQDSGIDNSAFATDDAVVKLENDSNDASLPLEALPTQEVTHPEALTERNPNSPSKAISAPLQEDYSTAISDLLAKTRSSVLPSSEPLESRRRILGRVTSNISTTSSVDSTATHGHPVQYPLSAAADKDSQIEMLLNGDKKVSKDDFSQPPPTQLQYEDPESEAVTERVMARLKGEEAPKKKAVGREKAATMGDLGPKVAGTRRARAGLR